MDAITLLKSDHQKVKKLFAQIEATNGTQKQSIYEQIKAELEVHTHIEETIFYPQMKEEKELEELVLEGVEEHHQAKLMMREIDNLVNENEKFEPRLKVLIEEVEHHIKEEEKEMFPKIEKLFDRETLELIGRELEMEKQKYNKAVSIIAGY